MYSFPNIEPVCRSGSFGTKLVKQVKIEDFEFKKKLEETEYGNAYLAKLAITGEYYKVVAIRKNNLLEKKGLLDKAKTEKEVLHYADHPCHETLVYLLTQETMIYFVMTHTQGITLA